MPCTSSSLVIHSFNRGPECAYFIICIIFLDLVVKLGQYMIFKTDTILIPIFGSKEFSILAVILFLLDTRHKKNLLCVIIKGYIFYFISSKRVLQFHNQKVMEVFKPKWEFPLWR